MRLPDPPTQEAHVPFPAHVPHPVPSYSLVAPALLVTNYVDFQPGPPPHLTPKPKSLQ